MGISLSGIAHRGLLAFALALMACVPAIAQESFSFSITPQFERRKLFGIWQPIVEDLQRRTGLRLNLVTSLSVGEYERDVRQGNFDFVYMNPYLVLQVAATPGYVPLIRDQRPLRGILVVRKDSPYQKVEDLQGKTIAVPSWTALGASLLLRAELDRTFRVKMRAIDAKTHSSVFLHVLNDLADAGGAVQKTLAEQEPAVQGALRVLHSTQEVPSHPLAAHGRVPPLVRDKIRQAFIDMASSEEGRRLLAEIPMQKPVPATVEDYRPLQALALERYLQP